VADGQILFHLHECGAVVSDEEGQELPTHANLREAAIKEARSIMSSEVLAGRLCLSCRIEVADEDQKPLLVVPLTEAVKVTGL
jgi:hypothetical protein